MISEPVFKFCTDEVAKYLLAGSIRVSSLAYFGHLESAHGWDDVGDRLEAGSVVTLDGAIEIQPDSLLTKMGIFAGTGTVVAEGSAVLGHCPDVHAFCAAAGDLNRLAQIFCTPVTGYSRAVRIPDPQGFANALYNTGSIAGVPVHQLFEAPDFRAVEYGAKTVSALDDSPPLEGCFTKPSKFERQQEARLCLSMRDRRLHDILDIVLPDPERWIEDTGERWDPRGCGSGPIWEQDLAAAVTEMIAEDDRLSAFTEANLEPIRRQIYALPIEALHPTSAPPKLKAAHLKLQQEERAVHRQSSNLRRDFSKRAHRLLWQARVLHGIRLDTRWTGRAPYTGRFTTGRDLLVLQSILGGQPVSRKLAMSTLSYCPLDGHDRRIEVRHPLGDDSAG